MRLVKKGDEQLAEGDIAQARLFYERAADAGLAQARHGAGRHLRCRRTRPAGRARHPGRPRGGAALVRARAAARRRAKPSSGCAGSARTDAPARLLRAACPKNSSIRPQMRPCNGSDMLTSMGGACAGARRVGTLGRPPWSTSAETATHSRRQAPATVAAAAQHFPCRRWHACTDGASATPDCDVQWRREPTMRIKIGAGAGRCLAAVCAVAPVDCRSRRLPARAQVQPSASRLSAPRPPPTAARATPSPRSTTGRSASPAACRKAPSCALPPRSRATSTTARTCACCRWSRRAPPRTSRTCSI